MTTIKRRHQKGKDLENYVADQIKEKGIDPKAVRDGASGASNREKGDIITSMMVLDHNAGIECKNQKKLLINDWWEQTQKLESLGREPMLVFKQDRKPFEDSLCVMYLDTVLELIKSQKDTVEIEVTREDSREMKWALENSIRANKSLLKVISKEES